MSWSFQVSPAVPVAEFESAARAALEKATEGIRKYNPEGEQSALTALLAAIHLVKEGIVGDGEVGAYLSGHGNPDHVAPPGWSKDTVTITLHRTDA